MQKIIAPLLFLFAQFLIAFWGNYSGKIGPQTEFFGATFNNPYLATLLIQFKYIWLFVIINYLFSLGFHLGYEGYKGFFTLMMLWLAAGPITAFLYNYWFNKESLNWIVLMGALLIFAGSFLIVTHKEILNLLK